MKKLYFLLLCFFVISSHAENIGNNKHLTIARCFFVYAPIYEVAKKSNNEKLLNYGLQRMMYIKGALNSLMSDENFKSIFERDLKKNKADGLLIEEGLLKSLKEKDAVSFNNNLRKGEICDKELGI